MNRDAGFAIYLDYLPSKFDEVSTSIQNITEMLLCILARCM